MEICIVAMLDMIGYARCIAHDVIRFLTAAHQSESIFFEINIFSFNSKMSAFDRYFIEWINFDGFIKTSFS